MSYIFSFLVLIFSEAGPGFLFEAGRRTFRPVLSRSKSGTLMSIFEGFVLFFIIIIFKITF